MVMGQKQAVFSVEKAEEEKREKSKEARGMVESADADQLSPEVSEI